MPDEGVEELVAEGRGPGLAGEHCAEVCAARAHGLGEADHGGVLGGHRHVLGRGREPMMYVPWWVNNGWFQAMRSSSSG